MLMLATHEPQQASHDFWVAISPISEYQPAKHPALVKLQRRALLATKRLLALAVPVPAGGEWRLDPGEETRENLLGALNVMRSALTILEGHHTKNFVRDVRHHLPHLSTNLEGALSAATEAARELLAFLAFIAGEPDDDELGIEVMPPPIDEAISGPSVSVDSLLNGDD